MSTPKSYEDSIKKLGSLSSLSLSSSSSTSLVFLLWAAVLTLVTCRAEP